MNPEEEGATPDDETDAAFAAGLNNDEPTETPALVETAAEGEPAQEEPPKYRQITEDEWNQYSARAAKVDEIDSIKATLEKSLGTAFGKLGGFERTLNEKLSSRSVGNVTLEDVPESLRAELPELAEALVAVVNKAAERAPAPTKQEDEVPIDERINQAVQTALLTNAHEDWRDVVQTDEFKARVAAQPAKVQERLGGWDAAFVSKFIAEHKAAIAKAKEPKPSARKERIEAAATPRGTGGHAPGPSSDDQFLAGLRGD
jgi:phage terminase Nu1 subunit (DNA packaging protein)